MYLKLMLLAVFNYRLATSFARCYMALHYLRYTFMIHGGKGVTPFLIKKHGVRGGDTVQQQVMSMELPQT